MTSSGTGDANTLYVTAGLAKVLWASRLAVSQEAVSCSKGVFVRKFLQRSRPLLSLGKAPTELQPVGPASGPYLESRLEEQGHRAKREAASQIFFLIPQ